MRALMLIALLSAAVLAGCASQSPTPTDGAQQQAGGGWHLDCQLGSYEKAANASWGQTCEARGSHTPGPKEETWIGVNPTDPNNVIVGVKDLNPALSAHCVWNGLSVTKDGGKSWKDVVIGGTYASRQPGDPFYGYACNTDPDFRFTKDGAVHYGVEMYNLCPSGLPDTLGGPACGNSPGGYKILLATSKDGGLTWPQVITFQPDIGITTDYSRMTIVPTTQTILEAIGSEGGAGCNILRSADGGQTASFEPVATKEGFPCNSGAGSAIAASPKGVAVMAGASGIVARSTDDGMTWTDSNPGFTYTPIAGSFSESKYRTPGTIELAYDLTTGPHAGTLYACYPAADRDEADVYVRSSTDDGKTWTDPVLVNDDAEGPHQWMCNVAVAGDGSVHVFFMDKRYTSAHKLIDLTHAWSMDGGKTWTNERASTISYNGDLGVHQEGFPFIGDYLGVDAVGKDVWAGFPDASNGKTTLVAAAHVHMS